VTEYCSRLRKNNLPRQFTETLDTKALSEELIFLGLRTTDGIDEDIFYLKTGDRFNTGSRALILEQWQKRGLLTYRKPFWSLTEDGLMLADGLARELM